MTERWERLSKPRIEALLERGVDKVEERTGTRTLSATPHRRTPPS